MSTQICIREGDSSQNSTSLTDLDVFFLDSSKNIYIFLFLVDRKANFIVHIPVLVKHMCRCTFCVKMGWREMDIFNTSSDMLHVLAVFKLRYLFTGLTLWAAIAAGSLRCCMYVVLHILTRGISQEMEISVQEPWTGLCFCKETMQEVYLQQSWATSLQQTLLEGFSSRGLI